MSTNNNNTAPNNNGAVPNHQQNSFNQASTNQQPFVNAPTVFFQNVPSSVPLPNTTNPAVPQFESVVDMENFAKFQQEQAKQFTLFQQQQAAVFLQIALQQQKQQLVEAIIQQPGMQHAFSGNTATIIPNTGLLYPGTNRSSSTSPANSFANMNLNEQPIVMNSGSLPMYIPNTHINPTNTLSGSNGSAMSDMSSSFGDKESAMTTSPPNSSNMGNTEYDAESNMGSERHQILMANQRRTGPVRRSKKGGWSEEEDEMLRLAVETYGGKNWKKIAETLQNRTSVQCLHRWQKVLNPNLVKGPWTKEEDDTILQLVKTYGAENWSMIASHLPGRIGKQCRERWYNHLDPNIKKEPWTEQEEKQLLEAQLKLGNKWAEISKIIPGRTDNACKNHYNSLVAREKKKTVIPKATPSTTTRKQKKPAKSPDSISKARHKRSLSDTVFYQNYQYESPHHHDGLLAPPVLSPMATSSSSNRSGNNSPIIFTNNSSANNQLPPPQPSLLSSLITPQFNFPFNQPMIIPNTNAVQQNFIPLHRPNVQKPATTNTTTDSNVKRSKHCYYSITNNCSKSAYLIPIV